ncbi:unnamed protein product [Bursaphelenchus xylophilus]|uniref:(pine wood nematode) hypothetical protein n=1 Tax=Bursaphelenchus xylophilus TaxID=6326 RepID=A0A1I7SU34_BURXY|nr:unnamed protein product [Bursaphelenchus xylophilus]CAG9107621.1 unnamed protein product [Bursaphelenchus xylophilus]
MPCCRGHVIEYISPTPSVYLGFFDPPRLDDVEIDLLIGGSILILLGLTINFILFVYNHFNEISTRKRALRLRDAMIIPPRCDSKGRELGMMTGRDWRDYFIREEPFVEE